jgi:hypothetical protein
MHRHTCYLLALGIAANFATTATPCRAQIATDDLEQGNNEASLILQSDSDQDASNSTEKSTIPSDTVSQTSVENTNRAISNPRIPIPSRIFPALVQ